MAVNCPNCLAPLADVRPGRPACPHCGAALPGDSLRLPGAGGAVIEGVIVGGGRFEASRHTSPARLLVGRSRQPTRRGFPAAYWLSSVGLAAVLIAAAIVFHVPIAEAFADLAGAGARYEGLEFRAVRTETRRARSGRTLLVEGEIVNRSGREVTVPAIRLTLRGGGAEIFSWSVEPTAKTISAGRAIGFRSIVAPPDPRDGEVALSFIARQDQVIGMR